MNLHKWLTRNALVASSLPIAISILSIPAGFAQSQSRSTTVIPRQFDVASIKLCKDASAGLGLGSGRGGGPLGGRGLGASPGRLNLPCHTVRDLIEMAYLLYPDGQKRRQFAGSYLQSAIKGGPAWIHSDVYTIEAKADGPASQLMMMGPMLQALLEERFRLKVHRESATVSAYALRLVNSDTKLHESQKGSCFSIDLDHPSMPEPGKPPCGMPRRTPEGFDLRGETMKDLSILLSSLIDQKVIDETGLNGTYDLHLDIPQEPALGGSDPTNPPGTPATQNRLSNDPALVFAALRKLGLKLGAAKGTVEFLFIDRVEKPSEN